MILVVADDLSGAAEIASLAVAAQLTAEVRTDLADWDFNAPRRDSSDARGADVIVFDSATRSSNPTAAYEKLREFAKRFGEQQASGAAATPLFKKVDSVLRGPILAELSALSTGLALLLPANPSRGRVIRGGRYFVNDVPLDASLFAADPEYPATTADVRQLLVGRSRSDDVARRPSELDASSSEPWLAVYPLPLQSGLERDGAGRATAGTGRIPNSGVVVPDIRSNAQLTDWVREWSDRGIIAGAADSFQAWLAEQRTRLSPSAMSPSAMSPSAISDGTSPTASPDGMSPTSPSSPHERPPSRVFVCGSHAAWLSGRHDQCRRHGIPVVLLPDMDGTDSRHSAEWQAWLAAAADALSQRRSLMLALGERVRTGDAGQPCEWAERLADAAQALAERTAVDQWFLEGGATAAAVVRGFGWSRLAALPMLAPGVTPLCPLTRFGEIVGPAPTVIVKPGSYDWPAAAWRG